MVLIARVMVLHQHRSGRVRPLVVAVGLDVSDQAVHGRFDALDRTESVAGFVAAVGLILIAAGLVVAVSGVTSGVRPVRSQPLPVRSQPLPVRPVRAEPTHIEGDPFRPV